MKWHAILNWIDAEPPLGTDVARRWYEGMLWSFAAAGLAGVAGVVIGAATNPDPIPTDDPPHPVVDVCNHSQESSHGVCRPSDPHDQHGG